MFRYRRQSAYSATGIRLVLTGVGIAAVVLLIASGCASAISAVSGMIDDTVGAIGESREDDAKMDGSMSDEETGSDETTSTGNQSLFGGMADLQNVMLFNVAYLQVVFLGGHDPGFEDFREGEGVKWEITGGDGSDQASFVAERALLRRNTDGTSWWFLGYSSEGEVMEYEVLMDDEYAPVEIVWQNEGSAKPSRHTFDYDEEEEPSVSEEEPVVYSDEFTGEHSLGNERVTVGAGTFNAEHVSYEIDDPETSARLEYDWWLADEVPGDLVKYEYRQTTDGDENSMSGELVATGRGYETKFDAY